MAGVEIELGDARLDIDLLALDPHPRGAVHEDTPERTLCLVSGHHDGGIAPPQVGLEMMSDATCLAHAAGRDDGEEAGKPVDRFALFDGLGEPYVARIE